MTGTGVFFPPSLQQALAGRNAAGDGSADGSQHGGEAPAMKRASIDSSRSVATSTTSGGGGRMTAACAGGASRPSRPPASKVDPAAGARVAPAAQVRPSSFCGGTTHTQLQLQSQQRAPCPALAPVAGPSLCGAHLHLHVSQPNTPTAMSSQPSSLQYSSCSRDNSSSSLPECRFAALAVSSASGSSALQPFGGLQALPGQMQWPVQQQQQQQHQHQQELLQAQCAASLLRQAGAQSSSSCMLMPDSALACVHEQPACSAPAAVGFDDLARAFAQQQQEAAVLAAAASVAACLAADGQCLQQQLAAQPGNASARRLSLDEAAIAAHKRAHLQQQQQQQQLQLQLAAGAGCLAAQPGCAPLPEAPAASAGLGLGLVQRAGSLPAGCGVTLPGPGAGQQAGAWPCVLEGASGPCAAAAQEAPCADGPATDDALDLEIAAHMQLLMQLLSKSKAAAAADGRRSLQLGPGGVAMPAAQSFALSAASAAMAPPCSALPPAWCGSGGMYAPQQLASPVAAAAAAMAAFAGGAGGGMAPGRSTLTVTQPSYLQQQQQVCGVLPQSLRMQQLTAFTGQL